MVDEQFIETAPAFAGGSHDCSGDERTGDHVTVERDEDPSERVSDGGLRIA